MAIGFRGAVTAQGTTANLTLNLTALTGGSGSAALADDVVLVWGGRAASVNDDVSMSTAGYTELADLYANDTADINAGLFRKVMGGTPDTSAVIAVNGTSVNGAFALAMVFSGVDITTPEDVAATTNTGINGNLADPPSNTPSTAGAWPVTFYAGATDGTAPTGPTAPGDITNFVSITATGGSTRRGQGGSGTKTDWTSGAFDPSAWSGTTNAANDSWAAAHAVLRPATGGGDATANSGKGSVDVAGIAPTSSAGVDASAGVGAVSIQGLAVTAFVDAPALPGKGSVDVQGQAPTSSAGVTIATGKGSIDVQGLSATSSASVLATPVPGVITLQGLAVTASVGVGANSGTGVVTVQGFAPDVSAANPIVANTTTGQITVQGYAPTLLIITNSEQMNPKYVAIIEPENRIIWVPFRTRPTVGPKQSNRNINIG